MTGFNSATFPLQGRRLIEASAGTGKTYNIANLYLRLLLGDGCVAKTVDEILVVTFTRAATDELRGRIRQKVEMARHSATDREACRLLNNALLRMDEACIFTIHGFAVRAIQTFLFETGALANVEISESGNARHEKILGDLWRELQLTHDSHLIEYVQALGINDREKFSAYFSKSNTQAEVLPAVVIRSSAQPLTELLTQTDGFVDTEYQKILAEKELLTTQWKKICAKTGIPELKTVLGDKGNSKLFEKLDSLLMPTGKMAERMMLIHDSEAQDELAVFIRNFVKHIKTASTRESLMQSGFRALLVQYLRHRMSAIDLESMQLDEVVSLINQTLQAGGLKAAQLRGMITSTYPVCMVDEFQDTDPAQFAMFNQLYQNTANTGFFMIGDPKQSIYQFRGADIFSYLGVRKQVQAQEQASGEQHIFSLDTNFRSKQNLVAVTNRLFTEKTKPSFVFSGIDYVDVKSCEAEQGMDRGQYNPGHKYLPAQPLVFVGNPTASETTAKINGDTLRWKYASDTAQRIAALLNNDNAGTINGKAICGGDIAVLVRTGREANAIRAALAAQTPRIGSVFQSQRDSIFSSSMIAEDIYHLLCAIDDPKDKSLLKSAMATLFYRGFSLDFSDLDSMAANSDNTDADSIFERLIKEFDDYRYCWENYGVLSALDRFVSRHELMTKIARLPDCDRLVTDLRHLGELLQTKYLACSSREELLVWFARQLKDDSDMDEDAKRIRLESDDNLVKIVTIHVSKGLEYPIVFLPFFFLPWLAKAQKNIPLCHLQPDYRACVDFSMDDKVLEGTLQKEILAEDMRLLYVAITRAVFQCYIGISASVQGVGKMPVFDKTVWAHLLGIEEKLPEWSRIKQALQARLGDEHVACVNLFDLGPGTQSAVVSDAAIELLPCLEIPELPKSNWVITSYTALANAKKEPGMRRGGADELPQSADADTDLEIEIDSDNIRYRLKGSSRTGDCLHSFYEQLAKDPARYFSDDYHIDAAQFDGLLQRCLRQHGLEKPEQINVAFLSEAQQEKIYAERRAELSVWLQSTLDIPLIENSKASSLRNLYRHKQVLAELDFDFALGTLRPASIRDGINVALQACNVSGIHVPEHSELEGLVTGSIDLMFIHDKKVYVLDYKSNTLGKAPRLYNQANMTQAMLDNRYDLQYLIYSVAAHRYMQQRLGSNYAYDTAGNKNSYSFGGVFYLFLRGMGLNDYPGNGIWFHRAEQAQIMALDAAFRGEDIGRAVP